jgi:hypothetical protein
MTSQQYEELCRQFLVETLHLDPQQIYSGSMENPRRLGLPRFAHQVDLCWETETDLLRYLHIANAKWHGPRFQVQLPDVLLLQQIKLKLGAHKGILLTNTGYSEGALAAALDEGVALYVVRPEFDGELFAGSQPQKWREQLQAHVRQTPSRPLYSYQLILKGTPALAAPTPIGPAGPRAAAPPVQAPVTPGAAPSATPQTFPGYRTKRGPGPGFRIK